MITPSKNIPEFRTAIKPMYYMCKLLGLMSFPLKQNYEDERRFWRDCIPAVTWITIETVMIPCFLIQNWTSLEGTDLKLKMSLFSHDIMNVLGSYLTILVITFRSSIPHQIVCRMCRIFSILVQEEKTKSEVLRIRRIVTIQCLFALLLGTTVFIVDLIQWDTNWLIIGAMTDALGVMVNTLVVILLSDCALLLSHFYSLLSTDLKMDFKSSNLRETWLNSAQQTNIFRVRQPANTDSSLQVEKIRKMRIVHDELSKILQLINAAYSLPVLMAILWILFCFLSIFYFIFLTHSYIANLVYLIFRVIVLLLLFLLLSLSCQWASNEGHNLAVTIRKCDLDAEGQVCEELDRFLKDTLYFKVVFNVAEIFAVNLQFFFGIIGLAISYMFLMVQLTNC